MKHVVSLSGGTASAVAAKRVMDKYGNVTAEVYTEGRNPLQVADSEKMIFNQKHAYCSRILKQEPFKKFISQLGKPITVHLGLDWQERHRHETPKRVYEEMDGVSVDFPLMWQPWLFNYQDIVKSWGIDPPRLYKLGFPHNNCGGRCVRQGKKEWMRLRTFFPDRFAEVRDWEQQARSNDDNRSQYAICRDQRGGEVRPMTLQTLEQEWEPEDAKNHTDDLFGCFCAY